MQKQTNPFALEIRRDQLAKAQNYAELRKTYAASNPAIPDQNTPKKWDALNTQKTEVRISNPMEADRLRYVSSLITGENITIVDIGFGSGSLEKKYFQSHSQSSVTWFGIEISPKSVKKVQSEFPKGKFTLGNILDIKLPSNHFDYAVSLEVLEHIPPRNTFQALSEVFRIIKPGGHFIISVPLNEGLEEMIVRGENPNAHVRTYTSALIKAELTMTGFTILNAKTLFAFPNWYGVKTLLAKYVLFRKYKPNNIILLAQKPGLS